MYKLIMLLIISIFAIFSAFGMDQTVTASLQSKTVSNLSPLEASAQIAFLQAASQGTAKSIDHAEALYKKLMDTEKNVFNYQLHIASLTAQRANTYFWPNQKVDAANKSIEIFNSLLKIIRQEKDPLKTYEFYLYRGLTYCEFPDLLNKRQIAKTDLQKAYDLSRNLNRNSEEKISLYYHLALLYYRDKEYPKAKSLLTEAVQEANSFKQPMILDDAKKANALLQDLNKVLKD